MLKNQAVAKVAVNKVITIHTNLPTVQKSLNKRLLSLTQTDKVLRAAALASVAKMRVRVFSEGKNSAGGMIGTYSTKIQPYYWFTSKTIPKKFQGRLLQYASKKSKGGIRYYKIANHKDLRQKVGLQTAFVDLEFTGQMRGNFVPIPGNGKTTYGLGWTNPKMAERVFLNEQRYGRVFSLTAKETAEIGTIIRKEVIRLLTKNL